MDGTYSAGTRFDNDKGTNPRELMGSALASCYSMALSGMLERARFIPQRVDTEAKVHLKPANGGGFKIISINFETKSSVPKIDEPTFKKHVEEARKTVPYRRS
ncbi:MAG: OsmC family peroxiredoxin [Bacteroidota bacterium]